MKPEHRRRGAIEQPATRGGGGEERHGPAQAAELGDVARAGGVVDAARDHEERPRREEWTTRKSIAACAASAVPSPSSGISVPSALTVE